MFCRIPAGLSLRIQTAGFVGGETMRIRRAEEKDIPRLHELLGQVLQIHADIRPDIFIPGTTKYTDEELRDMIHDDQNPIYIAADEQDNCEGYAFCQLRQQPFYRSCRFLSTIYVLTRRPEDSISARACSSLSSRRRRGLAAMRCS